MTNTNLSMTAEQLYTNFILRDILAKVIPGLIFIVGLYMAAFGACLEQTIDDIRQWPTIVIALLFLVSWTGGFVVQELGTWCRLLRTEPAKKKELAFVKQLERSMVKLNSRQLLHVERMVVIKEASGNLAVALILGAIFWFVSFIPAHGSLVAQHLYLFIKGAVLFIVVVVALLCRHRRAERRARAHRIVGCREIGKLSKTP